MYEAMNAPAAIAPHEPDAPAPSDPAPVAVEVRHVTKRFGEGDLQVIALADASLTIRAGEFLALVGPSGSGKTTLLNIIAGLERASEGTVVIDGQNILDLSDAELSNWRARRVGLMFQSNNLIPVLNALQNVALPLGLTGCPRHERAARAAEALRRVGLAGRQRHFQHQLSLGEQQRVALARAIVHRPSVIILDEPTGNLDRGTAYEILNLLAGLNRDLGTTVIMVTHDPKATEYASRVVALDKGVLR